MTLNGLTGPIRFDYEGLRTDFQLEVIELSVSGMQQIGQWSTEGGFQMNRPAPAHTLEPDMRSLMNKSFVVVTAIVGIRIRILVHFDGSPTLLPSLISSAERAIWHAEGDTRDA